MQTQVVPVNSGRLFGETQTGQGRNSRGTVRTKHHTVSFQVGDNPYVARLAELTAPSCFKHESGRDFMHAIFRSSC
jgi:hypothetical protein